MSSYFRPFTPPSAGEHVTETQLPVRLPVGSLPFVQGRPPPPRPGPAGVRPPFPDTPGHVSIHGVSSLLQTLGEVPGKGARAAATVGIVGAALSTALDHPDEHDEGGGGGPGVSPLGQPPSAPSGTTKDVQFPQSPSAGASRHRRVSNVSPRQMANAFGGQRYGSE